MSLIQAARTDLRAPQKTNRSLAKNALASLLRRTDALSLSKRLHTSPVNDACASFTDAVLDSLLFENRRVPLPRTRDHLRVPTAECVFLRRNFPTISSAICLACANPRNQLVPLRRAQDANSRSAQQVCQADSCTPVQLFCARKVVKCPTFFCHCSSSRGIGGHGANGLTGGTKFRRSTEPRPFDCRRA